MARSILLLSGLLTFIIVTYSTNKIHASNQLNNIKPQHYDIEIKLNDEENSFFGECNVNIQILKTMQKISMFSEELGIISVTLINNVQLSDKNVIYTKKVNSYTYDYESSIINFYFNDILSPGHYILILKYSGVISIKGGFQQFYYTNDNAIWLSATYFQPLWVRRIFPCWVSSESTFNISVHHSQKYIISSNLLIRTVDINTDNMQWTHFNSIFAISPYKIAIFVTNFTRNFIDEDDIVNMWCRKELPLTSIQFALTIIRNITSYLKNEWKHLQFQKLNYIVIPNLQERNNSVMNLESIIFNEADVMYNEEKDNIGHKYNIIHSVGNQVIREWLQSLDNPFYWPNSWLSKGFNIFFATQFLNQTFPNLRIIDLFVVQTQHECFQFDVDNKMLPPTHRENVSIEFVNHMRASIVLRMLQYEFYVETFWKGIHAYLDAKLYDPDSFWKALKMAYDEENPNSYNILIMLYPWTNQKGFVLNVFRDHKYIDNEYVFSSYINISIEHLDLLDENLWIPMSYATQTFPYFDTTAPRLWLSPPKKPSQQYKSVYSLFYREDGWIIFNIQQTGYYRVNYDDVNWQKIAEYLNHEKYWRIHVLNRAQIIDDAFHFLLLRKLKSDIFWQLAKYLSQEKDFIAWYPMVKAIKYMSKIFPFQEIEVINIKQMLHKMLSEFMVNMNFEENFMKDDFTKILGEEVLQLACLFGEIKCLKITNNLLIRYLQTSIDFSPWTKKWMYCFGLVKADNYLWYKILKIIKEDNDKILYLLTCPNLDEIEMNIHKLTPYIKNKLYYRTPKYKHENESYEICTTVTQILLKHFHFTITSNVKNYQMLNQLLYNLQSIKPRLINMPVALLIIINNIHSAKLLDETYFNYQHFKEHKMYIQTKINVRRSQLNHHMLLINIVKPTNETYAKFLRIHALINIVKPTNKAN